MEENERKEIWKFGWNDLVSRSFYMYLLNIWIKFNYDKNNIFK